MDMRGHNLMMIPFRVVFRGTGAENKEIFFVIEKFEKYKLSFFFFHNMLTRFH